MKHRLACIMVLCMAWWGTSCKSPPSAGTMVFSYPSVECKKNSRIVAKNLVIEHVDRGPINDLLNVQITAQNVSRRELQIEYRYRWLDKNGMEVKTIMSSWREASVASRDFVRMQGVAPSKLVTDFEFMVRFPNRM